ncbi:hypothetical protein BBP40_012500 [Aspergillus hancockii]|nr:hypothetical protein BBP40_012500 [Aspergillus hancockii]
MEQVAPSVHVQFESYDTVSKLRTGWVNPIVVKTKLKIAQDGKRDVHNLIPWVFRQDETTEEGCTGLPSREDRLFTPFFDALHLYSSIVEDWCVNEGGGSASVGLENSLKPYEVLALPRISWGLSSNQESGCFIHFQAPMLKDLMRKICRDLNVTSSDLWVSASRFEMRYLIGGSQYGTRAEGAISISTADKFLPIISFTGWYEGQTWNEFLVDTLSVMLGQLAKNIKARIGRARLQDQEVFVVGFHGYQVHIARGYFSAATIARIHSKGCSEDEVVELQFSRGYDLCYKGDWVEATRVLARLFRYLLSGGSKVGAMHAYLDEIKG